jgi:DUF971 family protein
MTPTRIKLHRQSKTLELHFGAEQLLLPAELLRVYSPSAEVKGHGPGQEVLQTGKRHVGISTIEAAGNYALRITFDDGHDSGIFGWDYLYDLGARQPLHWQDYEARLNAAGKSRDPDEQVVKFVL